MSAVDLSDLLGAETDVSTVSAEGPPPGASAGASGGVAYDGASKLDQLARWQPVIRSADAEILPEKGNLDARIRDTLRNDSFIADGIRTHKDSIVGARYQLTAKPETKILWGKEDDAWEVEFQEEVETKFTLYAESDSKLIDAARKKTLTDHARMGVAMMLGGGEILMSAEWMPADGRSYRTALQMIDPDRLSTPDLLAFQDAARLRNGVERDRFGAPIAYYIRNTHPTDGPFHDQSSLTAQQWTRVPARKPWGRQMVLHVFEEDRPDQSRGVSTLVTGLSEMRMTKHFRRTELSRAVVAASYAASIESEIPEDVVSALGDTGKGVPTVEWMSAYLAAINAYNEGASNLHMDGARIPVFAPGTKLKIQNPGANGPVGDKFEQSLLRYIAASLGLSYEQFAHDFTQTNYSSARAAIGEIQKGMASKKRIAADAVANFGYRLWLEEAINSNSLECLKRRNVPKFYDGLNSEAYSACEWVGAGQGMIDPLKETQAALLQLKAGLATKELIIARLYGGDYRRVARQIKRERDLDSYYGNPSVYDQADTKDMQNALSGSAREGNPA